MDQYKVELESIPIKQLLACLVSLDLVSLVSLVSLDLDSS